MCKIDSITAINIVRDTLRENLVDPYTLAGGRERPGWIFADEPIASPTYPLIQIKKSDNPSTPIDIGDNYMEHEQVFMKVWCSVKNGAKLTVSGVEYVNASLVEYMLGQIKQTLKSNFNTMFDLGVGGYKHVNTTQIGYNPDTQLYFGAVTVRVWFFTR